MAVLAPQLSGLDPVELVLSIVLLVVSLGIHEAAHAWVALRCGDPTGRDLGRITLNPIPHIDLVWTLIVPAVLYIGTNGSVIFGGAKPVPVTYHRLRRPLRDMSLVALAGPVSNLILAVLFVTAAKLAVDSGFYNGAAANVDDRWGDLLPRVLFGAGATNVLLSVFNLIPIPPLDGSRVMEWVLPAGLRDGYARLGSIGIPLLIALIYLVPGFNRQLGITVSTLLAWIDRLVPIG